MIPFRKRYHFAVLFALYASIVSATVIFLVVPFVDMGGAGIGAWHGSKIAVPFWTVWLPQIIDTFGGMPEKLGFGPVLTGISVLLAPCIALASVMTPLACLGLLLTLHPRGHQHLR